MSANFNKLKAPALDYYVTTTTGIMMYRAKYRESATLCNANFSRANRLQLVRCKHITIIYICVRHL